MNKNSMFDLTPLLDVILILLFAILINGQFERSEADAAYESALSESEAAYERSLAEQATETSRLSSEILELNRIIDELKAVQDSDLTAADLKKYEALQGLVRILDVRLESRENLVIIDGVRTNLYLLYDELATPEQMAVQRERLKTLLQERLNLSSGMVLLTLSEDGQVFRYAYQLVHSVILELVESAGPNRLYYMQIN